MIETGEMEETGLVRIGPEFVRIEGGLIVRIMNGDYTLMGHCFGSLGSLEAGVKVV